MPESDSKTVRAAILAHLQGVGKSVGPKEAAEIADTSEGYAQRVLAEMVEDGALHKPRHGKYTLPGNAPDTKQRRQADSDTGESPSHDDAQHTHTASIVHIPEVNLEASCGDGSDPDGYRMERVNGELRLPEWYIRAEYGVAPARVMQIRTRGTSMLPTIAPGQKLLVAKREDEPIQDGMVYVILGPHGLLIKRLFHEEDEDGRHFILIHSDNRRAPRQTYRVPAERFGPGGDYRIVAFALEISKKL